MRHGITEETRKIIEQAVSGERGTRADFCRATGIKPYELSRILSGKKTVVFEDIWAKIRSRLPQVKDDPRVPVSEFQAWMKGSSSRASDTRIERIKDAIMASNELTPEAKATAYRIITETK